MVEQEKNQNDDTLILSGINDRDLSYFIIYFFIHGNNEIISKLINKFIRTGFKTDNKHYGSGNEYICDYILNSCQNRYTNQNRIDNLVRFFRLIHISTNEFIFKSNNAKEINKFFEDVVKHILEKEYFYVWDKNTIIKYSINHKFQMYDSPIIKEKHYQVKKINENTISIYEFNNEKIDYGCLSIKTFISSTSKKNKKTNRGYNNDSQRYLNFYNSLDKLLSEGIEEKLEYCPMCNPYGKAKISRRTKKRLNKQFCHNCSEIFNKLRRYINENSEKRLRQNLSRKFKYLLAKEEFYNKRLEALERGFDKELKNSGIKIVVEHNRKEYYSKDSKKSITNQITKILQMFKERFIIKID